MKVFIFAICAFVVNIAADTRKPLNGFIKHHERLSYVVDAHVRTKRSTDVSPDSDVSINFESHNKNFSIHLKRNHFLFSKEFKIVDGFGNIVPYDYSRFVHGDVEGFHRSYVIGKLDNGRFEGSIHLHNDQFHVEPAEKYFKDDTTAKHHSVIYSHRDVEHNARFGKAAEVPERPSATLKGSSLYKKMVKENDRLKNEKEESKGNGKQRYRRGVTNREMNTCTLKLVADHLFLKKFVRRETAIDQLVLHYQAVEHIFRQQTFNTTGEYNSHFSPQSIGFRIAEVHIWNEDSVPESLAPVNISIDKLLENFSQMQHDTACLAYLFTDRTFDDGIMGLAYVADRNNQSEPGGICEFSEKYGEVWKTYNTGVVSFQLFSREAPPSVTEIIFAHQLGHSFGAEVKNYL